MITLKQVEAFYWVGMLGSFAAAADKIHVAQSTISKRILELESALDVALFDRELRSGRLTQKGTEVLQLSEQLLRMRDKFLEAANNSQALSGTLRLGITELVAVTWLPALLSEIKTRYPLIVIEPEVDLTTNLYKLLDERSIDVVIGPMFYRSDVYSSTILAKVEQAWVCSPELYPGDGVHPLAFLKTLPILMQPSGSALRLMLNRQLDENDVRLRTVISCNTMTALAEMASAGLGVTCLPREYFEPEIRAGRLRIIETDPPLPKLTYGAACRRDAVGNLGDVVAELSVKLCKFTAERRLWASPLPAASSLESA